MKQKYTRLVSEDALLQLKALTQKSPIKIVARELGITDDTLSKVLALRPVLHLTAFYIETKVKDLTANNPVPVGNAAA